MVVYRRPRASHTVARDAWTSVGLFLDEFYVFSVFSYRMDSPKQTAKSFLQPYQDHDAIEGIMEALPPIEKFNEHENILNSLESRVEAYQRSNKRSMELRKALEMVYDEEVQRVPHPNGYFGVKCYLGNIFFPKALLDTSWTSSFFTFDVFMKLHKASITWDKPHKIKHQGQDLKVYGMIHNYHVHIGSGLYLMDFMVVRHMNANSHVAKHDLVFGNDLLFQVSPRFNTTKTPCTLENSKEIEVTYFQDGDFECDDKSFIVIPTSKKNTHSQRQLPKPKVEDIEEGEFLEGDYVESDSELEAYYNALIDDWVEDIPVVKRRSGEKSSRREARSTRRVKDGVKFEHYQGIPLVIISSDDEDDDGDSDARGSSSLEEGFVRYP